MASSAHSIPFPSPSRPQVSTVGIVDDRPVEPGVAAVVLRTVRDDHNVVRVDAPPRDESLPCRLGHRDGDRRSRDHLREDLVLVRRRSR